MANENKSCKARNWCFTDNNLQSPVLRQLFEPHSGAVLAPTDVDEGLLYLFVSVEIGDSGTLHMQGYTSWDRRVTMARLKKAFECKSLHCEVARGTATQNEDYIAHTGKHAGKQGLIAGPISVGSRPKGQGARSDITHAVDTLVKTKSLRRVAEEAPEVYLKYHCGLSKMKNLLIHPPKTRSVRVSVVWGPPGTGKTRHAVSMSPDDTPIITKGTNSNIWWDDYDDQQSHIILDEFRGSSVPYHLLLRLLDVYRLQVDVKGSRVWGWWSVVYITSNLHPSLWYSKISPNPWALPDGTPGALQRRINSIEYFGDVYSSGKHIEESEYRQLLEADQEGPLLGRKGKISADMDV